MLKKEVEYWLALQLVPRLAIHKKIALVDQHGLALLFQSSMLIETLQLTDKQKKAFLQPDWLKITQIIDKTQACQSDILGFDHPDYPQLLKEIYDPPLVLFVKGNKKLLNKPQVAIVGSRSATISGCETAVDLSQQLAILGLVITSGLALGIDAAAHRGALGRNGATIAVIATGIDLVYPQRHKKLMANIVARGGTIISEFLPGTPPRPGHFPKRNRVISGLSKGVLVVEAALKSGSLITAQCALEQGREVYAVPGAIGNPLIKGCHWLIKQGAKLVEECEDIIKELDLVQINDNKAVVKPENNKQQGLFNDQLLASVDYEVTPVDKVVSRSKLPTEAVLTRLTMLELKGLVMAVPGGYLRLNRG